MSTELGEDDFDWSIRSSSEGRSLIAAAALKWRECDLCDGTEYTTVVDEVGYHNAKPCFCRKAKQTARQLTAARIPPAYIDATPGGTDWSRFDELGEKLRDWMEGWELGGRGLLITGPTGTGKGHLAALLLRQLIMRGTTGRFFRWAHYLDEIRATYNDGGLTEQELLERFYSAPIAVVDDLGSGHGTGVWESGVMEKVLGRRLEDHGTCIITTNLSHAELLDLLDTRGHYRVWRRLQDACDTIEIAGQPYGR